MLGNFNSLIAVKIAKHVAEIANNLFAVLFNISIVIYPIGLSENHNAAIICSFGVEDFVLFLSTKGVTEKLSN